MYFGRKKITLSFVMERRVRTAHGCVAWHNPLIYYVLEYQIFIQNLAGSPLTPKQPLTTFIC